MQFQQVPSGSNLDQVNNLDSDSESDRKFFVEKSTKVFSVSESNISKEQIDTLNTEIPKRRKRRVEKIPNVKILVFTTSFLILTGLTLAFEIALAINYFLNKDIKFSALTFCFTIFPSLLVGFWGGRTFFFRILFTYISTTFYGCKAVLDQEPDYRKWYSEKMLSDHTDSSAIVVLRRAIETAPQILIQLSILLFMNVRDIDHKFTTYLQTLTIFLLVILLTVTIVFWDWSLWLHENKLDENFSLKVVVVRILAYFFITTARMLSISLLAFVHPKYSTNALFIHIIVTSILVYSYSDPVEEPETIELSEIPETNDSQTNKTNIENPRQTNMKIVKHKIYFALISSLVLTFMPFSFTNKLGYIVLYLLFLVESVLATLLSFFTVEEHVKKNTLYISFLLLNYISFALASLFVWISVKHFCEKPTNTQEV